MPSKKYSEGAGISVCAGRQDRKPLPAWLNAPATAEFLNEYSIRHPEVEEIEVEIRWTPLSMRRKICDFMKIDAEGAELQVLLGARSTLAVAGRIFLNAGWVQATTTGLTPMIFTIS